MERLLAYHGEQHLADGAVRLLDGGAGQIEQQALLAADALEVVQQLLLDLVFRTRANVVHGFDQQVDQGIGDGAPAQVGVGGQPDMAGRLGVAAQLMGRLDGDALAACLQLLLAPVGEQVGGQAELADCAEPGQLVAQAGDAGAARACAQVDERGIRPPLRHRLIIGSFGALGTNRLQQGIQPGAHVQHQAGMDRSVTPVLIGPHRRTNDPRDAVWRGRLNAERAAPGFDFGGKLAGIAGPGDGVVAQPGTERLRVGDTRFAVAEQGAYFGPLPLQRAVGGVGQQWRFMARLRHAERARQFRHGILVHLCRRMREAAAGTEKQQHDRKAQPVAPAPGLDQQAIRWREVPNSSVKGGAHLGKGGSLVRAAPIAPSRVGMRVASTVPGSATVGKCPETVGTGALLRLSVTIILHDTPMQHSSV